MADFVVTSLFPTDVDSDWLFPGPLAASFDIVDAAADHFSIRYTSGPANGLIVMFVSDGSTFTYNVNSPASGFFNEIRLVGEGMLPNVIAKLTSFPSVALTSFGEPNLNESILDDTDMLTGGAGKDVLRGYDGANTYIGKGGNDIFVLELGSDPVSINGANFDGTGGGKEIDLIDPGNGAQYLVTTELTNIDGFVFSNNGDIDFDTATGEILNQTGSIVSLDADQFGTGIATAMRVSGVPGEAIALTVEDADNFNAAKWKLTKVDPTSILHIAGTAGADSVVGWAARDVMVLGNDNDRGRGGAGSDFLFGEIGNDILTGGRGLDTSTGGIGSDRFDFNSVKDSRKGAGHDIITDFNSAENDRIDLRTIDANTHLAGNQKFHFIGGQNFHHTEGELRFKNGLLQGDVDGNGKADFEIQIDNITWLVKGDFIL
jgi:serralysin